MSYTNGLDDPSAYFQIALYTGGNGLNNTPIDVTNSGNSDLQPDWVWIKRRDGAASHGLFDSSRGVNKILNSDTTDTEVTGETDLLDEFKTDGFGLGANTGSENVNKGGTSYVAWQWKANGGTTSSNTDGSITSTVQADTTAGFSIVTYTGTGSNATVGHGLGVKPAFYIIKNRDNTTSNDGRWMVWHQSLEQLHNYYSFLFLHLTNSRSEDTTVVNATPNTTTFAPGTDGMVNNSGQNYVAYCFAEKQGYSKFGSYTGNGNADGAFVYTGFKPAWIMFKKTSGVDGWGIFDNRRGYQNATNPLDAYLQPNNANAESGESDSVDFLSNGFKWRISSGFRNESGQTYIYMAFAESPFVSSEGAPTTAR